MDSFPIGEYALMSNSHGAALVSRDGSVDWLCFPRFDSPSVFCRLLDPAGGHFSIRPAGDFRAERRYADQTMVLETTFTTPGGTAVLTDALAAGQHERGHDLGARSPSMLLRRLACTAGEIEAEVSYSPRPEYGLVHPILAPVPGGLAARGGADRLLLSATAGFDVDGATATARSGWLPGRPRPSRSITAGWATRQWRHGPRKRSRHGWKIRRRAGAPGRRFTRTTRVRGASWCIHSGRVLRALTFDPTGAIVAAPTTSLPEAVGGERNWDYRFTWVRDASLTMEALWVAACPDEASKFFAFLADAAASLLGERDGPADHVRRRRRA